MKNCRTYFRLRLRHKWAPVRQNSRTDQRRAPAETGIRQGGGIREKPSKEAVPKLLRGKALP